MPVTSVAPSTPTTTSGPRRLLRLVLFGLALLATVSAAAALPILLLG